MISLDGKVTAGQAWWKVTAAYH